MRSQEQSKPYRVEVADKMLIKAERLDVEESEYICYHTGQPRKAELLELLKSRFPDREYEIIEQINGQTITRINNERKSATSQ
jgi:hypothetical protein